MTRDEFIHPNETPSPRSPINQRRITICVVLIVVGIAIGMASLPLITNQYGNTDAVGFALLGLAGWLTATGVAYFFTRFTFAVLIGVLAAPLPIVGLVVLFWLLLIVFALANSAM